jgi:hypothetical protein
MIDNLDQDEWDFPAKPKWMRWHSYERYLQRFEAYEEVRDHAFLRSVNRLTRS